MDIAFKTVEYVPAAQAVHAAGPGLALNVPLAHAEHVPPSSPLHPALHLQSIGLLLPSSEFESDGHRWQVAAEIAPTTLENWASEQLVQAASPGSGLYLPAMHSAQACPLGPVDPILQVQSVCWSLLAGESEWDRQFWHTFVAAAIVAEYWPCRQLVHAAVPASVLYFPATHAVHVPPSAPVYPALHLQLPTVPLWEGPCALLGQFVHLLSPLGEKVCAGHTPQSLMENDASTVKKNPGPHGEHCVLFNSELKNPETHAWHSLSNITLPVSRSFSVRCA